jgi:transposase
MRSGGAWSRIAWVNQLIRGAQAETAGFSSKRSCGSRERGSPWRDLPPMFGNWNSVFARFRYWVKAGVFKRMFEAVSDEVICGDVTLDQELTLCLRSPDRNAVVKRQNPQAQLRLPALIDNLSGLALQMQRS